MKPNTAVPQLAILLCKYVFHGTVKSSSVKRFRARIMNINKYDFTKSLSCIVCHIHLGQGHECFLSVPAESYNSITVCVLTV